jgi:glucose-1-phosphate cytidylyltransferase
MKVVILCGGYGTRIREVSDSVPKPMVPIGNYPILWHIMKYYAHWGHREFVLCLGYKGDVIKDFFLNYESRTRDFTITLGHNSSITYNSGHAESDWSVTLAETGLKAMTGARVKRVEKYLAAEDNFMLTYGDAVSDVDLSKLMQFHLNHGKILTITGVRPPGRFGELVSDSTGKIIEFNEKPQVVGGGRISGGFFLCRKEIFNYLDAREDLVFEIGPMGSLVADGQAMVYEHDGFWLPMDTPRDYQMLNGLYDQGKAAWIAW